MLFMDALKEMYAREVEFQHTLYDLGLRFTSIDWDLIGSITVSVESEEAVTERVLNYLRSQGFRTFYFDMYGGRQWRIKLRNMKKSLVRK